MMAIIDYLITGESESIQYDLQGYATRSRVVHFGHGDIAVIKDAEDPRTLMFLEKTSERHNIGEHIPATRETVVPPLKFRFDKPESIDVVIGEFLKVKQQMLGAETQGDK